jgi:hypothetical protein
VERDRHEDDAPEESGDRDREQAREPSPDAKREPEPKPDPEPRPEPGVTAPLDDFTEAERHMGPVGVMPGAGPDVDPDDEAPPAQGTEHEADRAKADRSAIDDDVAEGSHEEEEGPSTG